MYVLAHHSTGWDGLLSGLQEVDHALATQGLQACRGTYAILGVLNGSAQLFARGRSVTAITVTLDDAYTSQAVLQSAFLRRPRGDALACAHGPL